MATVAASNRVAVMRNLAMGRMDLSVMASSSLWPPVCRFYCRSVSLAVTFCSQYAIVLQQIACLGRLCQFSPMSSRRYLLRAALAAGTTMVLRPPSRVVAAEVARLAGAPVGQAGGPAGQPLITKAIPATGEKLPVIGLGTDQFRNSEREAIKTKKQHKREMGGAGGGAAAAGGGGGARGGGARGGGGGRDRGV